MAFLDNTDCCALHQLIASNSDSNKEIKKTLKNRLNNYDEYCNACFCITRYDEIPLEKKLTKLKFIHIFSFKSHSKDENDKYYILKMWVKELI